jgi:hypothetical protein
LLVTIGVFAEVVLALVIARIARRIDLMADAEIAKIRLGAASAEERAAEANRIAESERLARVQIEERLRGWTLTGEAEARLVEKLKPFAKTPFDLSVNPLEERFMVALDDALIEAGWERKEPIREAPPGCVALHTTIRGRPTSINSAYGNPAIEMAQEQMESFGPAAQALGNALVEEGIPIEWKVFAAETIDPKAIHVVICRRE